MTGKEFAALVIKSEDTEMTNCPYWAIVTGAGGSRNLVQGIWFSRETAELALKNQAHNLPEKAYVYCYSGGNSNDYKSLYRAARSELGVF